MFEKILIANRGEIAVRIIRACRELGIRTVAVFSDVDKDSLHVKLADEAVCIGPANSIHSYLNIKSILAACEVTDSDAVHPGFGFLSENADFANKCKMCGVEFIGPSSNSISLMGDKISAKETMKKAGVPIIPGSDGIIYTLSEAEKIAEEIGYPVMIKATFGGGGKGIRLVQGRADLESNLDSARNEAKACFGNSGVYIEKFIENPRHIEFQILADKHGNFVHLGERDCSLQRRNQKVIEESPSVGISEELRKKMGDISIKAAKFCNYYSVGTIEYLVDKQNNFYFMEMNTRIQVEHPVTEFVTGVDIIKEQISISYGKKLSIVQQDIQIKGHSIECRINAENPYLGFRPSPGKILGIHMPGGPGIRIDSSIYAGYTITPYYDSMIAKLIVYGKDREEAILKMKSALAEFLVDGVDTNIDFHLRILKDKDFIVANYDIGYIDRKDFYNDD